MRERSFHDRLWAKNPPGLAAMRVGRRPNRRTEAADAWRKRNWKTRKLLMNGSICKGCGEAFTDTNGPTMDHIIPKAGRKGISNEALSHPDNFRVLCERCNVRRGVARHCVGLLACALAVVEGTDRSPGRLINKWFETATAEVFRSRKIARKARRKHQRQRKKEKRDANRLALIRLLIAYSKRIDRLAA